MSTHSSSDAYRLTNMALSRKLVATLAAACGAVLFLSSWGVAKLLVKMLVAHDSAMRDWAAQLANVAWGHPMAFSTLLLAHYAGLAIILLVSQFLFRRTTMRRRVRKFLGLIAILCALLHVRIWFLLPTTLAERFSGGDRNPAGDLSVPQDFRNHQHPI